MADPVVHDHDLNEAFRSDVPKKPEPTSEAVRIDWVEVVPKFIRVRGVQITTKNLDEVARLHLYDTGQDHNARYILVPGTTGDVRAYVDDWILVADDNWDIVTVCSAAAFTRNYEVQS